MKRIIFVIFLSLIFSGTPRSFASELDGTVDTSLGTNGYVDWTSSVDWNVLNLIKLSDGNFLHFGASAVTRNTPGGCPQDTTIASAYKTNENGTIVTDFGNDVSGAFQVDLDDRNYFVSAAESLNGDIFLLGTSQSGTQVVTSGGIGCEFSNNGNYVVKISRDGEIELTFGESGFREIVESTGDGFPTHLSILNNRTLLISFAEDSSFDLLSLSMDGTINPVFGNSGKVKLLKSDMRVLKSVQVDSTVILFGDKYNPEGDGSNRWAVSSVDLLGNELDTFRGNQNYEYSSGEKETISEIPQILNSQIYIVGNAKIGPNYEIQVLRLNKNGEKDQNYGGYLRQQLLNIGVDASARSSGGFSLDQYGRILISMGTDSYSDSGQKQSVIVRLDQDGLVDRTFGDGGKIWTNYNYQTGIAVIDLNKFLIYGSRKSSSYCAWDVCGLYKMFISQVNQLPMNAKPLLTNVSSGIGEVSFSISNFDPQSTYVPTSNFGQIALDVANRTWKVTNLGQNARTIFVEVLSSKSGFGSSKIRFSAQSADIDALQRLAQLAAEAKREAEKVSARSEISNRFRDSERITIEIFQQADIRGVTSENLEDVQIEILALPKESRSDIVQILRVARKFEVIGKIASNQVYSMQSNEYVEIGLIPNTSKNKTTLVSAVRKLPAMDRDSFAEVKLAIAKEMAKIQARKDRTAAIKDRISSRG